MEKKCLLFAYGLLKPAHSPPRSLTEHWPDRIKGQLFDLGPYPAAIALGKGDSWIVGYTLTIDSAELYALDEFEDVESGEFSRRLIETELGHTAWVYEYQLKIPQALLPISQWRP